MEAARRAEALALQRELILANYRVDDASEELHRIKQRLRSRSSSRRSKPKSPMHLALAPDRRDHRFDPPDDRHKAVMERPAGLPRRTVSEKQYTQQPREPGSKTDTYARIWGDTGHPIHIAPAIPPREGPPVTRKQLKELGMEPPPPLHKGSGFRSRGPAAQPAKDGKRTGTAPSGQSSGQSTRPLGPSDAAPGSRNDSASVDAAATAGANGDAVG